MQTLISSSEAQTVPLSINPFRREYQVMDWLYRISVASGVNIVVNPDDEARKAGIDREKTITVHAPGLFLGRSTLARTVALLELKGAIEEISDQVMEQVDYEWKYYRRYS